MVLNDLTIVRHDCFDRGMRATVRALGRDLSTLSSAVCLPSACRDRE